MALNIRPLADRVVVEPVEQEETFAGGELVLPDTAKEKPQQGNVLAVGAGRMDDDGNRLPMDVGVGDTMTLNIFGRDVTAEIANLREIDWSQGGLNFVALFAPGALEAARPPSVASVYAADLEAEERLYQAVTQAFPAVTVIRTREAVEAISNVLGDVGLAIRAMSAVAVTAGLLVLAGAIGAVYRARLYDAAIMKAAGAERRDILAIYGLEYAALGAAPALIAAALSLTAGYFTVTQLMDMEWTTPWGVLAAIIFGAAALTMSAGLAAAWRLLGAPVWPILRSE